jgi:hypothetical protein
MGLDGPQAPGGLVRAQTKMSMTILHIRRAIDLLPACFLSDSFIFLTLSSVLPPVDVQNLSGLPLMALPLVTLCS